MNKHFSEVLVCPSCKGPLIYNKKTSELICRGERLAFPVTDDIPQMLETEARTLEADEEISA